MPTQKFNNEILMAALEGFEVQKHRIDEQIAELRQLLDGSSPPSSKSDAPKVKRHMSAAARKRIADAQRKRWAQLRKPATAAAPKAKRRLSAAGKAAIVAALKKRWAAKKAAE